MSERTNNEVKVKVIK